MYQDHVSIINQAMRSDPDIFLRGVTFAFLSMRTQFVRVAEQMREVDAAGSNARALWGFKRGGYDFLRLNKIALFHHVSAVDTSEEAIETLCKIPGMGIVKAAFVCQMMGHDIGCLDTRNVTRLGLNPREWRSDGEDRKNTEAFKRKVKRYVDFTSGKAEQLWNNWCADVANVYKTTAEDISRDHLVIVPPRDRTRYRSTASCVPVITRSEIPFAA